MLKLLIIATLLVGLAIAGIAIRMFVLKDGQFKKSCSSLDPQSGQKMDCTCGGNQEAGCDN